MDFIHDERDDDVPIWVSKVAKLFEDDGSIGAIVFRKKVLTGRNVLPVVYIGCGCRGSSTSYSTVISEIIEHIGGVTMEMRINSLKSIDSDVLRNISPDFIISKYISDFDDITLFTSGRKCLAICDMNKKEIFIPDLTVNIAWTEDVSAYVTLVSNLIHEILGIMKTSRVDLLVGDISKHAEVNKHIKYVEVVAETEFDSDTFAKDCMESLISYETIVDRRYADIFNNLRNDVIIARNKGVSEALSLIDVMKAKHFVFVNSGRLKYTGGKIVANTGVYADSLYHTKSTHWVSGLKIHVEDGKIYEATCYRAFHPNCSGRHICLGELRGIPMEDAEKIVLSLTVPNFSNGYWSDPGSYIGEKIIDIEGSRENVWSD